MRDRDLRRQHSEDTEARRGEDEGAVGRRPRAHVRGARGEDPEGPGRGRQDCIRHREGPGGGRRREALPPSGGVTRRTPHHVRLIGRVRRAMHRRGHEGVEGEGRRGRRHPRGQAADGDVLQPRRQEGPPDREQGLHPALREHGALRQVHLGGQRDPLEDGLRRGGARAVRFGRSRMARDALQAGVRGVPRGAKDRCQDAGLLPCGGIPRHRREGPRGRDGVQGDFRSQMQTRENALAARHRAAITIICGTLRSNLPIATEQLTKMPLPEN